MTRTSTRHRTAAALAAVGAASLALSACGGSSAASGGSQELHIYAWADEIPQTVVDAFEEETGITVTVDSFDSNETMIAKLSAGADYDLVEPSQYAVQQLIGQELVVELDHAKIEGLENLAPKFADPSYDPGLQYSVPWIWGTTGLLYNATCFPDGEPTTWDPLFDPALAGKTYMLDNMLSAYIPALQHNGFQADTTDVSEIETATQSLLEQKPILAGYNSSNYADLVSSGAACAAEAYSGTTAADAVAANPDVKYILPTEGGTIWTDGLSIAKDAPNADAAYEFISFTLRPEIAAMATDDGSSASVNAAAKTEITNTDLLNSPAIYPSDEALAAAQFIVDPGAEAMEAFQSGWTQVKAS